MSEITQFLQDLKQKNPQLEDKQKEGRARLWDKPQNPELTKAFKAARVPQKAYVYGSD